MIQEWTRGQWALRATVVLGPVLALLAAAPAGAAPWGWLVVLVAVLAAFHARWPESAGGIAAPGVVVLFWGAALGDRLTAWALAAAAALLAAHVAALLAAYGPDGLGVDVPTLRLWLRRAGAAFLLAPAVLLPGLILRDRAETPGVWVVGLAVALVATVVATAALGRGAGD